MKSGSQSEGSVESLSTWLFRPLISAWRGSSTCQGKVKEALEVVSGPQGDVASMSAERTHLTAVLLMMSGDLAAAAGLWSKLLLQNPDDWSSLQQYCDCVMGPATTRGNWPESSLLRLSGGLMAELCPCSPRPTLSRAEIVEGHNSVTALIQRMAEEVGKEGGGHKLTMRGPDLAFVSSSAGAQQWSALSTCVQSLIAGRGCAAGTGLRPGVRAGCCRGRPPLHREAGPPGQLRRRPQGLYLAHGR